MDESKLDENRIGRKQDWTKRFGPKQVGRKLGARKKIASNVLRSEIQDGSRRFFLNEMYYYILDHVSYGNHFFLLVYFCKEYMGMILLRMNLFFQILII